MDSTIKQSPHKMPISYFLSMDSADKRVLGVEVDSIKCRWIPLFVSGFRSQFFFLSLDFSDTFLTVSTSIRADPFFPHLIYILCNKRLTLTRRHSFLKSRRQSFSLSHTARLFLNCTAGIGLSRGTSKMVGRLRKTVATDTRRNWRCNLRKY